jgi:protein tyrosine phosphatase (PTP) superfamily phosphohydrolase (DUF442 family)
MTDSETEAALSEIYHFLQISETLATAGRPTEEQLALLKEAGYAVVINLALPNQPHALLNEAEVVAGLGMEYINIPVLFNSPTADDLERTMDALDAHADQKVFLHCMANYRVAVFVYLYRVLRLGVPREEAELQLYQVWQPNEVWAEFIEDELARRTE